MIYGIGVDIIDMSRMEALRGKYDDPFLRKTFTEKELEAGMARADPVVYFSERFAAKEAVLKALRIDSGDFKFSDIETLNDGSGKPYVILYGYAKTLYDEIGGRNLLISLSYDGGSAVAFAVCEV